MHNQLVYFAANVRSQKLNMLDFQGLGSGGDFWVCRIRYQQERKAFCNMKTRVIGVLTEETPLNSKVS